MPRFCRQGLDNIVIERDVTGSIWINISAFFIRVSHIYDRQRQYHRSEHRRKAPPAPLESQMTVSKSAILTIESPCGTPMPWAFRGGQSKGGGGGRGFTLIPLESPYRGARGVVQGACRSGTQGLVQTDLVPAWFRLGRPPYFVPTLPLWGGRFLAGGRVLGQGRVNSFLSLLGPSKDPLRRFRGFKQTNKRLLNRIPGPYPLP